MAKIITDEELASIVTKLLLNPEDAGQDFTQDTFAAFMSEIAQTVCDYCGGDVGTVRAPEFEPEVDGYLGWSVAIRGSDSLPEDGGIWKDYDPEGEL